jgi:two-component system, NtrC family, nitrogen regulation sensor histidine kinase GlnL
MNPATPGLDILATAVLILDAQRVIRYINPAAENLFGISAYHAVGRPLASVLTERTELVRAMEAALQEGVSFTEHHMPIESGDDHLTLNLTISPLESDLGDLILEFHSASGSVKIARDEQAMAQAQAVQMLLKQLAHEIRNPLGGLRGAAQLLEAELNGADLSEYTQVIIQEANRLQGLLDRWLTPAKRPAIGPVNLHEVMERVRNLLSAEYPELDIARDYDISVPEIQGDQEQLIQAVLNIARNAAQAIHGVGTIKFATRVSRQVTLAMKRWKLAARIDIIDYGPGIPEEMQDMVFFPLVSGRENGTGVGLTLAQSLVQRHEGTIHMVSEPGFTCFSIYLPIK